MKHREPPSRIAAGRLPGRLQYDPQVRKWCKRLQGDPDAKPTDVSDEQLAFLTREILKQRGEEFDATLYEQALADLTPVVSAPLVEDPLSDLQHVFAQRPMQTMWRECATRGGKRGPAPNWAGALSVLCLMSMTGRSKEGKRPLRPGDKLKNGLYNGRGKAWRGYILVIIACQATGIPLVWTVIPANEDEAAPRALSASAPSAAMLRTPAATSVCARSATGAASRTIRITAPAAPSGTPTGSPT